MYAFLKHVIQILYLGVAFDFFRKSLKYLGLIVDEFGLRTDPDKVAAMFNFPQPSNPTEIKRFVGMCSW